MCFVDLEMEFTVEQLLANDPAAWVAAKRSFNSLVRLALRRNLSRLSNDEVETIAIDSIVTLIQKYLPSAGNVESLNRLLYVIARNKCSDFLEKRYALKRGAGAVESIEDQAPGVEYASQSPDPAQELDEVENYLAVRVALARLPELHRRVLVDRFWEELSYEKLAVKYGKTQTHIGKILFEAKAALEPILKEMNLLDNVIESLTHEHR